MLRNRHVIMLFPLPLSLSTLLLVQLSILMLALLSWPGAELQLLLRLPFPGAATHFLKERARHLSVLHLQLADTLLPPNLRPFPDGLP